MSEVYVGEGESLDSALKRFNKRVQAEGVLTDAPPVALYERGTWGPAEADRLLPEGAAWHRCG